MTTTLKLLQSLVTYQGLNHQNSLASDMFDEWEDGHCPLFIDHLQHGVQCDEGASPPHTSTAVHQHRLLTLVRVGLPDLLDVVDDCHGIGGHPMIRPAKEMELSDFQRRCVWFCSLEKEREGENKSF